MNRFSYFGAMLVGVLLGRGMGMFPVIPEQSHLVWGGAILIGLIVSVYILQKYPLRVWRGIAAVGLFGIIIEYVGILTCYPYGCFQYGQLTGPTFFGTFPYILLIIWPLLVICALQCIPISVEKNRKKVLFGAGGLILLDVFLDPVAVDAGVWEYMMSSGVSRYGVPISNYLGWIPVSLVSVALLVWLSGDLQGDKFFRLIGVLIFVQYVSYFLWFVV